MKGSFVAAATLAAEYPSSRQESMVPREFSPIVWHREGVKGTKVEEISDVSEGKRENKI